MDSDKRKLTDILIVHENEGLLSKLTVELGESQRFGYNAVSDYNQAYLLLGEKRYRTIVAPAENPQTITLVRKAQETNRLANIVIFALNEGREGEYFDIEREGPEHMKQLREWEKAGQIKLIYIDDPLIAGVVGIQLKNAVSSRGATQAIRAMEYLNREQ